MASETSGQKHSGSFQTGQIAKQMRVPLSVFLPQKETEITSGNACLHTQYQAQVVDEKLLTSWAP